MFLLETKNPHAVNCGLLAPYLTILLTCCEINHNPGPAGHFHVCLVLKNVRELFEETTLVFCTL